MMSNNNTEVVRCCHFVPIAACRGMLKDTASLVRLPTSTCHYQEDFKNESVKNECLNQSLDVSQDSVEFEISSDMLLLNIKEPAEQASSMLQNRKRLLLTTPKSISLVSIYDDDSIINKVFVNDVPASRCCSTNAQRHSSRSVSKVPLKHVLKMKKRRLSSNLDQDRCREDFCTLEENVSRDKDCYFPLPKRLFLGDMEEDEGEVEDEKVKIPTRGKRDPIPLKLPEYIYFPTLDDDPDDDCSDQQDSTSTSNFQLKPRFRREY